MDAAKPIIDARVMLAGARLADAMVQLYGNSKTKKTVKTAWFL